MPPMPLYHSMTRRIGGSAEGSCIAQARRGRGLFSFPTKVLTTAHYKIGFASTGRKNQTGGNSAAERRSRTAATTNMMATPLKSQEVGAFRRTSDQVGCRCPPCVCYLSGRSAIPQMCLSSNSLPAPTCAAPQSPHTLPHRARARRCTATRRTCPCVTAAACPRALGWTDWHASTTR